jgi:hypothetical protein
MSNKIAWARRHCQRLATGRLSSPEEVVDWLGAVQARNYLCAKWGLALRPRRASDASVEGAFAAGRILRTHVMRATWHFVKPAHIRWLLARWLLAVTAPRVRAGAAFYDRQLSWRKGDCGHGLTLVSGPSSASASSLRRTQRSTVVRPTL